MSRETYHSSDPEIVSLCSKPEIAELGQVLFYHSSDPRFNYRSFDPLFNFGGVFTLTRGTFQRSGNVAVFKIPRDEQATVLRGYLGSMLTQAELNDIRVFAVGHDISPTDMNKAKQWYKMMKRLRPDLYEDTTFNEVRCLPADYCLGSISADRQVDINGSKNLTITPIEFNESALSSRYVIASIMLTEQII